MAMSDYRLCDVCGRKAFYDANLNYEWPDENGKGSWDQKIEQADLVRDSVYTLDHLGDWAVICRDCANTHKCVVVPVEETD